MGKLAFEQRDSLQPIADKFKLPIKQATGLVNGRTQPEGVPAELGGSEFITAVFADDVARNKGNTQPVGVAPTTVVVARVTKHMPAHTEPFEAVKDEVRKRYVAEQSAKLAQDAAKARLAAVRQAPQSADWQPAVDVSRDKTGEVPMPILEAALRAPTRQPPHIDVVDLGPQGSAILRVNKVVAPEALPAEAQKQAEQQYAAGWSRAEMDAYYQMLKDRFKVKITEPDPKKAAR
jgi:peptidyl-prolyl cis-trans isomerase D